VQTLTQLRAGQLLGSSRLQLVEELSEFPREILGLADTLEVLDLSHNRLSRLPDDFHRLQKLKILFLSYNQFEELPAVLGLCPQLEMIGFKANRINRVAEGALPSQTRWLILTDNQIATLPESMGQLSRLQKLALAGNRLESLPASMADCHSLELVRLSANNLAMLPDWLLQLPRLSWLAFAGNSFSHVEHSESGTVPRIELARLDLGEVIGQGASGVIHRAHWQDSPTYAPGVAQEVAVKLFKGEITSDGYPSDELDCCLRAGEHASLIKVLAQIDEPGQLGLVMELIPAHYTCLGLPPSLASCTRDTFTAGSQFAPQAIARIAWQVADTLAQMHSRLVSHGDLYAHNMLVDDKSRLLLGDFGAASNLTQLSPWQRMMMERIEVRALGCLLDDLLSLCPASSMADPQQEPLLTALLGLQQDCLQPQVAARPTFAWLTRRLGQLVDADK
jgi:hypothetical protein